MTRRSYRQNCPLAHATDLIGERWTLLLVRDLLVSPRRFTELQKSMHGMGSTLLASRLKQLEAERIVERQRLSQVAQAYALTERGLALEPVVLALIRWGLTHSATPEPDDHHQDDWDLLTLKALYQSNRAGGLQVSVQFDAADFTGWMAINSGVVHIGLGEIQQADLIVAATIKELFTGSRAAPGLLVRGDQASLEQFMSSFALRA